MTRSTKALVGCSNQAANSYVEGILALTQDMTNKEFAEFVGSDAFDCTVASWVMGKDAPYQSLTRARLALVGRYNNRGLGTINEIRGAALDARANKTHDVEVIAQFGDIHRGRNSVLEVKSAYIANGKRKGSLNVGVAQLYQGVKKFLFVVTEEQGDTNKISFFVVPTNVVGSLMERSRSFEKGSVNLGYFPNGTDIVTRTLSQYKCENATQAMRMLRDPQGK
jgi:hypothetical protein